MTAYNPNEHIGIVRITAPTIGTLKVSLPNAFGDIQSDVKHDVVETDDPYLLWENGSAMSWEDGDNVLLEQQFVRMLWLKARR